ncbi:MAG TPA: sialidase family protein [Vicinamibacterales bacterium]|nr:sialidase family protein [Vicinamibacterales bacterium]
MRSTLIVLAVALNAWPWFKAGGPAPRLVVPAQAHSTASAPVFGDEILNPDSPQAMSHVASIAELFGGGLAAVWYAGSREGAGDVAIYFSVQSSDDGRWSPARAIVTRASAARELRRYIKKVGNPVLFSDAEGRLWIIYVTVSIGGWSGSSLNVTMSEDEGRTWTRSRRLTLSPFFNLSELVKNAPVALSDGGWAVPIYHEFIGRFPEMLWLEHRGEDIVATKSRMSAGWYGYQPALTPIDAGRALALLRDDDAPRTVSMARSEDAGHTWSAPERIDLPNPDSGLDAIRLTDGRLLLAFNDSPDGRENLRLAMSVDEGRTWSRIATLVEERGGDFSYPFLIQARGGDVHLVYTWQRKAIKHIVFNPAWLDERWSRTTR